MDKLPCTPTPDCVKWPNCFADVHHIYYPERRYKTGLEVRFRRLDENKMELCRGFHQEIHDEDTPPPKPTVQFMRAALNRNKRVIVK